MFNRYTDHKNITKNRDDFIDRHYGIPVKALIAAYSGIVIILLLAQYLLAPFSVMGFIIVMALVVLLGGGGCLPPCVIKM